MPPATCSRPSARVSIAGASMPFWNGIAMPPPATSGFRCGAAASTSHSLTQSITTSTGPIDAGSSVAFAGRTCIGENSLSMRRPSRRIASRCRPRATKVTSWPATASFAP